MKKLAGEQQDLFARVRLVLWKYLAPYHRRYHREPHAPPDLSLTHAFFSVYPGALLLAFLYWIFQESRRIEAAGMEGLLARAVLLGVTLVGITARFLMPRLAATPSRWLARALVLLHGVLLLFGYVMACYVLIIAAGWKTLFYTRFRSDYISSLNDLWFYFSLASSPLFLSNPGCCEMSFMYLTFGFYHVHTWLQAVVDPQPSDIDDAESSE